jgi:hypothetical protein
LFKQHWSGCGWQSNPVDDPASNPYRLDDDRYSARCSEKPQRLREPVHVDLA